MNDFRECLEYSEKASEEPFWDAVYRKAFPGLVNHMPGWGDTVSQRLGVDRVLLLPNSKIATVDEKKRKVVRDDILLEYLSNDTTGALGWIERDLCIDYLAYAFMPIQKVYLLPWHPLRLAWQRNREKWLEEFRIPPALNHGYRTHSVAVPIKTLYAAMNWATVIEVTLHKEAKECY